MGFMNESNLDRVLRVVLGIVLLYLGFGGVVGGGWGVFFKVIGFVPLLTGIFGFCPIYALLKIRTRQGRA